MNLMHFWCPSGAKNWIFDMLCLRNKDKPKCIYRHSIVRNFTHVFLDFCCTRNKNVKVNKSFLSKSMALTRESPKNSEKLRVLTFAVKVVQ